MIAAIALLYVKTFSVSFNVIYIYCGITDMMDGLIARNTHTESKIGAIMDSIADLIFVSICFCKILPDLRISTWLGIWILLIVVLRGTNLVLGYVYQHKIIFLHTKANKVTGFLLFLLPLLISFSGMNYVCGVVAVVATFAALQEGYFIRKGDYIV